jgi:hypothetical protein
VRDLCNPQTDQRSALRKTHHPGIHELIAG